MLPEKGVPSAVVGTVRRLCPDYAAGLEESSTGEVPRLQKFCRHNESLLRTVCGSEFQTAGAEHRKALFANVVVVKG